MLTCLNVNAQGCRGIFEGTGYQVDGQTWKVELHYHNDSIIYCDYPSLGCEATWYLKSKTKEEIILNEHVTAGDCDQDVEVHLFRINRRKFKVLYYFRLYDPVNPVAEVILEKERKCVDNLKRNSKT